MGRFKTRNRLLSNKSWLTLTLLCCCAMVFCCVVAAAHDDVTVKSAVFLDPLIHGAPLRESAAPTVIATVSQAAPPQLADESASRLAPQSSITFVKAVEETRAVQPTAHLTSEGLQAKQEVVASELRVAMLQKAAEQPADENVEANPQANASQVDKLKQIDVIVAQQQSVTATLEDLNAKRVDLEKRSHKLEGGVLDEEPPYSILLLDQLNDSISSLTAKQEAIAGSLASAREAVEQAKKVVDSQQKSFRLLKEKASSDTDPILQAAELDIRLAEEALILKRQEMSVEESSEGVRALQQAIDVKKLRLVSASVEFSKRTLNEQIAELDSRESELKRRVETLQSELQYAERRWLTARQELDSTPSPGQELLERVEAIKTEQQSIQYEQTAINQRLQRMPLLRNAWDRRYLVATGQATRDQRREWFDETQRQLDQLARDRRSRELKVDEVRVTIANVEAKADSVAASSPEAKRWLENRRQSLAKQIETCNSSILAIDGATRTLTRLQTQISGLKTQSLSERMSDVWSSAKRIWDYELTSIDDTSVTVGKVTSSLLFLFLGYFTAIWLSRLLANRLPKIGIDEAGTYAIESLSFYALLLLFALGALRYANVPLTVFTFLGGAIAIGVGFGSQNIVNNFISGLILLAERPIKVGDLIRIDDFNGNVTKIGARSTQIRTGENLDIVVPNSKFLENNVVNLTRRDDRLRTSINVGVAYGSDLAVVVELLERAATESPGVNDRPKPFVWFNDFGDNALAFQVHFWINARTIHQMRKIETEVRLRIDRLFRENHVVIAFPQRDLHLQTLHPLEFRMVPNGSQDDRLRNAG